MSTPPARKWGSNLASSSASKVGGAAASPGSKDAPTTPLSNQSKWARDKAAKLAEKVVESVPQPPQQAPAVLEPSPVVAEEVKVVAAVEAPGGGAGGVSDDAGVTGAVLKEGDSLPPNPVPPEVPECTLAPTSLEEPTAAAAAAAGAVETASPPEPLAISSPPHKGEGGGNSGAGGEAPPFPSSSTSFSRFIFRITA
jgi:hypothetical protein